MRFEVAGTVRECKGGVQAASSMKYSAVEHKSTLGMGREHKWIEISNKQVHYIYQKLDIKSYNY